MHIRSGIRQTSPSRKKHGEGVRVHEAPPPEKADVEDVVKRVHERALRWLRTHKYRNERSAEERGNEPPVETPIEGFASLALGGGTFLGKPFVPNESYGAEPHERKEKRFSATHGGFDVYCAVRLVANADEGRERLIRSCARPPFALERIEEMKDRRIA